MMSVADESWRAAIAGAAVLPAVFLAILFGSLFGWPFLLAGLLHGRDVDAATSTALAVAPMCAVPGIMIAVFGRGRNIPPPGDYVLEDLPLWSRYRRVWSLPGRRRLFACVASLATSAAVLGVFLDAAPVATASLDIAVLTTGITIALARSTQTPGRGPRLTDRFRP
jgi:hypothetical protein